MNLNCVTIVRLDGQFVCSIKTANHSGDKNRGDKELTSFEKKEIEFVKEKIFEYPLDSKIHAGERLWK